MGQGFEGPRGGRCGRGRRTDRSVGFPPLEAHGLVGELVAAAAKQRTKPDVLPGLEAQMPESGFIRMLNASGHVLDSDLTVIAGDSDGLLKNLANLFFWTANDLVVDTRSMYRGAVRSKRRWFRVEGTEVHHCNYFAREETVNQLESASDFLSDFSRADSAFSDWRAT